jgi:hypothetical protein
MSHYCVYNRTREIKHLKNWIVANNQRSIMEKEVNTPKDARKETCFDCGAANTTALRFWRKGKLVKLCEDHHSEELGR